MVQAQAQASPDTLDPVIELQASPVASPNASPVSIPVDGTPFAAGSPAVVASPPALGGAPSAAATAAAVLPLGDVGEAAGVAAPNPFASEPMGFYTDTSVCIGCKACEVACKEWNQLSSTNGGENTISGDSYDNTRRLDGQHWRHVKFIEQFDGADVATTKGRQGRWLMMSDVCKHCVKAPCLDVCPTGAIVRTEFDTVVIQSDVCNGCRACIGACPFGVIEVNPTNNTAMKCTLCYDRMSAGLVPACAQACPTASIQFGPIQELKGRAQVRLDLLQRQGETRAHVYGADDKILGGLGSFYLLLDEPEVYGLPSNPKLPSDNVPAAGLLSAAGAAAMGVLGLVGLRKRRMDTLAAEARTDAAGRDGGTGVAGD